MPRAPDERVKKAHELFKNGLKLIEIASQLDVPEGTVRSWKNRYKWNATLQSDKRNVAKRNKGGQPGNKNADGGPPGNKKAEKYGFFSKYLPEETFSIIQEIQQKDPLDILWENIQIAYAAIVRAQQIMHVKDKDDLTKELKRQKESSGEKSDSWEKEYELQFAWDKQANFLQAQARAQTTLNGMIKQYDELLHKNWDLATEEQKARIAVLKAKVEGNTDKPIQITFKKASESHG